MNLTVNAANPRLTNTGYILAAAATRDGTKVTRRQKGYSDSDLFDRLDRIEWIEPRATGPRGGITWHATRRGRYHLKKARAAIANKVFYDIEYRMRHKDGRYIWVRSRGQATWDDDGANHTKGNIARLTRKFDDD